MAHRTLRMDLLTVPEFWAAHLWNATKGPLAKESDGEIVDGAFGLSTTAVERFYLDALASPREWPSFRIPLRSNGCIEVEYLNEPEDYELAYRICVPGFDASICVGKGSGHWLLPAFRWRELTQLSRAAGGDPRVLLLLLPATWIAPSDDRNEVRAALAQACQAVGATQDDRLSEAADALCGSITGDVWWRPHPSFGWVNDGQNSRRNPDGLARLTDEEFSAVRDFFSAWDEC